jgi:hypothetical protein
MTGCLPEAEKKKIEKKRRGWINLLAGRASAVVRIRAAAYFFRAAVAAAAPHRAAPLSQISTSGDCLLFRRIFVCLLT